MMDHSFSGTKVDPEFLDTLRATGAKLQELGHEVVLDAPVFDWQTFFDATHLIWVVNATAGFDALGRRSEEHTSELQSLMRISYAVFCMQKKNRAMRHTT